MTSDINLFMCYDADYPREPESSMILLEMEVSIKKTETPPLSSDVVELLAVCSTRYAPQD